MSSMIRAGLTALALSGLVLSTGGAFAGKPDDKTASAKVQGVGPEATDAARHAAIGKWKKEVAEEGDSPIWRDATEKKVKCKTNGTETKCKVEARPAP